MPGILIESGCESLDDVLSGLIPGDNVVWVSERDAQYSFLEQAFMVASARSHPTTFVAVSQAEMARDLPDGVERIDATAASMLGNPLPLADEIERRLAVGGTQCLVFDGLDICAHRWGADEAVRFFSRVCPAMLQWGAVTYWRIPRSVGATFVEQLRQVTQCLLELRGDRLLVLKAESRPGSVPGSTYSVAVGDTVKFSASPAAGRLARGVLAVRKDLGLTQSQLAAIAGITPSAVSQAEAGTRGLSVDTLIALSDRLGVTLDRLVSSQPSAGYQLARHDRSRAVLAGGVIPLADDSSIGLRTYLVSLGGGERGVPPHVHKGVEVVAVVKGLVQVEAGDDTPVLRAGDSLLADTVSIRSWRNLRPDTAAFYWILRD
ncbi:MAG: XRE family transcriptional regulator [Ilumatobacteraceae bacterium]